MYSSHPNEAELSFIFGDIFYKSTLITFVVSTHKDCPNEAILASI